MLCKYIKRLIRKVSFLVFTLLDVIAVFLGILNLELKLQPYWYFAILIIGFFIANYEIYRENQIHISEIENLYPEIKVSLLNFEIDEKEQYIINVLQINESLINDLAGKKKEELLGNYQKEKTKSATNFALAMQWKIGTINPNYISHLDVYIEEYKNFLRKKCKFDQMLIKFEISIINIGTVSSTKNIIEIAIPSDFHLAENDDLPYKQFPEDFLIPPQEPEIFLPTFPNINASGLSIPVMNNYSEVYNQKEENISGPNYKDSKVYYEIIDIVPNYQLSEFEPFYIWLDKIDRSKVYNLEIHVYSANISKTQKIILPLNIHIINPKKT